MREECTKISKEELIKQHNTVVSDKLKAFKITKKEKPKSLQFIFFGDK